MTESGSIVAALDGTGWVAEGEGTWRKPLWRRDEQGISVALLRMESGGRGPEPAAATGSDTLLYCISGRYGDPASSTVMKAGSASLSAADAIPLAMQALEPTLLLEVANVSESVPELVMPDGDPLGRVGTRLLITNDLVNIWDVSLAPGESVPWHIHRYPYVVVTVEGGRAAIRDRATGEARQADSAAGNVTFDPGGAHHRLENVGAKRIMDRLIEFKHAPALIRPPRIQHRGGGD